MATLTSISIAAAKSYAISDTSITANSDILMELTDDGGVKSYSMEVGKMTVIRDTVPTQAIPYTYKVKQTNASGQFTLVNHFVPSIPESPTSLPVTYKKASGTLPTSESAWTSIGGANIFYGNSLPATQTWQILNCSPEQISVLVSKLTNGEKIWANFTPYSTRELVYYGDTGLFAVSDDYNMLQIRYNSTTGNVEYKVGNSGYEGKNEIIKWVDTRQSPPNIYAYTISDTFITANTAVKMYLTDEVGVKAYSKANGSIQVIRDTVPTTAIPYEYEVEQTSAEGLFEVINAYVPTKTSELTNDSGFVKTSEANTFTAEQTFSNANGIKANKVNNLNGNAWYDFDGTNDRFGSLATPTIIRTSEPRPKAEVPSGSSTATKEIALLEDTEIKGEWSEYTYPNVTLTESGLYQIWALSSSTASEHWEAFVYWDGTSLTKKQMFVNYYQSNDSEQTNVQRIYLDVANIRITNAGVLSIEEFNTKYSLEGALLSSGSSNAGFKYRKIN